jgi:hypothetical protein
MVLTKPKAQSNKDTGLSAKTEFARDTGKRRQEQELSKRREDTNFMAKGKTFTKLSLKLIKLCRKASLMSLPKSFSGIPRSTALRVLGLTEKSKVKPILGFSDVETVKLDFDDSRFETVRYWASRALRWFKLRGFLILKSSRNHYHVVFDREVSWSENMCVVAWVALESHNIGLIKWFLMQCIKGCSTLRVSPKKEKPSPRIVYRCGNESENIREFLKNRQLIKRISRKT